MIVRNILRNKKNVLSDGRKEKGVSQAGVQFYHDLIDELKRNGIMDIYKHINLS